ncbi:Transamidase GatB domain protein [Legionella beliardensis]|uniref:Transamidase GatB domain protein n=1 Tax=Legionella beliardensis TaxID=91822 RepID=A0A378HYN5_9GAMM|nr:GatB/YqeY domain-containing protein [Legionella beliardensis]STX28007.1 Transamidase GatB domain protein [Legionella beliardensis]
MSIKDNINNDLKEAMRAKDQKRVGTLRLVTAAIKQVEVDERITVADERMLVILDKLVKQRKESISQFQSAGRDDLVAQEQYELDVISNYLPEPLTEAEVNTLIEEAIAKHDAKQLSDMGKVMNSLKPLLQGRADLSKVSSLVKARLS